MSELTEQTVNNLINALDNICTLHEKQASLEAIDYAIEQARVLLNEIKPTNDSYIDTVLIDIHKEGDTTK